MLSKDQFTVLKKHCVHIDKDYDGTDFCDYPMYKSRMFVKCLLIHCPVRRELEDAKAIVPVSS